MTSPDLRNGVILSLTLIGGSLLTWAMSEDVLAGRLMAGLCCWGLAAVYAQITRGGR